MKSKSGPKVVPKWSQNGPKMVPKSSQNSPKMVLNGSKWSQNGPKVVSKWSQNASIKVKNVTLDVILSYDMNIFFKYLITHITKGWRFCQNSYSFSSLFGNKK